MYFYGSMDKIILDRNLIKGTLKDVDYLLPYHSHIEVSTTLEVLEYWEKQKQKRNMKKF